MVKISGYVDHFLFKSEDGYAVVCLTTEEEEVTCRGTLSDLTPGEKIEAEGDYVTHPQYGLQFKVSFYRSVAPDDCDSMERYLASGAIKGIGPALAARIVKKFKEETFRIIEEEPERLAEIKGISAQKAQEIGVQMEEKRDLRNAMVYLQQFGITNALAVKIYRTYGDKLYSVMQENPYRLAEDISGVGFRIADEIASKIGIHTDSDYRIRSGIFYVLMQAVGEGHCYLPMNLLLERAGELLGVDRDGLEAQIDNMVMDKKLVIRQEHVYASSFYYTELECAVMLQRLNLPMWEAEAMPAQEAAIRKTLENRMTEHRMELDELQIEAVMDSIRNGLFILSGGPGTGKTTTINMMMRYFEAEGLDILLAAPTGRAAKRMTEATGVEARTIHRLLELNSDLSNEDNRRVRFEKNEMSPLEADVVIIDEMSMVDIHLFYALLKAIVPGTRLILVGDVDQLPSVGPGKVLRDIMDSGKFPMAVLHKIFRQAQESDIIVNAHKINRGEHIALDNRSKDFFFLEREYAEVIYKHMIQLIEGKLPAYVQATPLDIQVLTPMRRGALGCETLNGILQRYLNPPDERKQEHLHGTVLFREGDKVMQIKNNYQLEWQIVGKYGITVDQGMGIFNGDMGRILEIHEAAAELVVEYDEHRQVTYEFGMLDELELAYAITIHKAQGSEYPAVLLPLLTGPKMLFNRNLLYTAITRAKQCVTILGSSKTIEGMIDNVDENKRYSGLKDRICEVVG
ncbi:MAG: ATP-dependent RecD-like DNA helicase [Lachnospiraceae bacterium]|nr:ATP-dependent RecD-like DNA helicase [Lachnospiraceae bacterium]